MALPPLAEVSDLAAWIGREISETDPRAGAVLSHASTKVRTYTGQTWVDDTTGALTEVPDVVAEVVIRVAGRVWWNREELDSVTVDDGTKRWGTIRGLVLTAEDREDLAPYRLAGSPHGLGIISTYRDDPASSTIYVPTAPEPSGQPFPFLSSDDL